MHSEVAFVLLFVIATAVAVAARWVKVPYTALLVLVGIALGSAPWLHVPVLSKELLFTVFLPGLIFEAAFHIDTARFWENKLVIHALAIPGVLLAVGVTGLILWPVAGALNLETSFRFVDALVFAGIVAATDPIAVVALFKSLSVPSRLGLLVEGESLLNDGTAIALFSVIFAVASGSTLSAGAAAVDFVRVCALGLLVGAGVGYAGNRVIHMVDDAMVEITVTVVIAWGSFTLAEQLHASGVLATVAAGLLCGNYAARTGMTPSTRVAVESFWSYIAFALNSAVFLLIGFQVHLFGVVSAWKAILVGWAAMAAARAAVIALTTFLLRRSRERLGKGWPLVMWWGGIRGGLSMVLALALPFDFPHRQFLIDTVFGVVVLSILLQGSTMVFLLKRLGLVNRRAERENYEKARMTALAASAAIQSIDAQVATLDGEVVRDLRAFYEERLNSSTAEAARLRQTGEIDADEERRRLEHKLILVEKDRVMRAVREEITSDTVAEKLLAELDARLVELSRH